MKKIFLVVLFSFPLFAQKTPSIGSDNNQFALALYSQIDKGKENMVFSPYGIFSNLSLLYFGAKGPTATEIQNALHFYIKEETTENRERFLEKFHRHYKGLTQNIQEKDSSSPLGYDLYIANALFPHQGTHILKEFQEMAKTTFEAKVQAIDFAHTDRALDTINRWINRKTEGNIQNFLGDRDLNEETRLLLISAIFFQGNWQDPFDPKLTKRAPFYLENGTAKTPIDVITLHKTQSLPYFEDNRVQCLALPFIRSGATQPLIQCLFLLPKKGTLEALENGLTTEQIAQYLTHSKKTLIDARIPKFCLSKHLALKAPLKILGMKRAFTYQADFSPIDGMHDLFVNYVLHKTECSFEENGISAASSTATSMGIKSTLEARPTPFFASHPFLFFIIDFHSQTILFMGRIMNPQTPTCNEN